VFGDVLMSQYETAIFPGKLIILDGIDGCGKSTLIKGLAEEMKKRGKKVFSIADYCKEKDSFPELDSIIDNDVFLANEPTYCGVGGIIRKEIIAKNGRHYSASSTAQAYSLDRNILYKKLIIPLLNRGKTVANDRSVTTSIIYQPIQAEPLDLAVVLSLEGNAQALRYRPDLLVIAKLNPEIAIARLTKDRKEKDDNAIFEKLDFLKKADERFTSDWFKELFESRGSRIEYIDMNRTIESEVKEFIAMYDQIVK
jgi:dTMP kinase